MEKRIIPVSSDDFALMFHCLQTRHAECERIMDNISEEMKVASNDYRLRKYWKNYYALDQEKKLIHDLILKMENAILR